MTTGCFSNWSPKVLSVEDGKIPSKKGKAKLCFNNIWSQVFLGSPDGQLESPYGNPKVTRKWTSSQGEQGVGWGHHGGRQGGQEHGRHGQGLELRVGAGGCADVGAGRGCWGGDRHWTWSRRWCTLYCTSLFKPKFYTRLTHLLSFANLLSSCWLMLTIVIHRRRLEEHKTTSFTFNPVLHRALKTWWSRH